ncbi:MAG: tetratricopeptide repeat protein [Acidobacteria bacterium]|nr:tetratricopeptide repeat protein [Acidobacteriota bacterium]
MTTLYRKPLAHKRPASSRAAFPIVLTTLLLALLMTGAAHMQSAKNPYDKERLLKVVRLNALSTQEIVQAIQQRGVDFQMTADIEAEFNQVGARPEMLEAMRQNFRGAKTASTKTTANPATNPTNNSSTSPRSNPNTTSGKVPPGAPLSKNEIVTLLQSGVPVTRVEEFVEVRGVNFTLNAQVAKEITTAGGNRSLLGAIGEKAPTNSTASTPNNSTNSPVRNSITPAVNEPDYDDLTDQAISAMQSNNAAGAIRLLQKAVAMDSSKPTAYQLLGFAYLYGNQNIASAETYMRAALERNGAATFRVYHDHDGFFKTYCQGTFFVNRMGVTFKADDGNHTFEAEKVKIKEVALNDFVGSEYGAFHVKVFQDDKKKSSKTFNFAPATTKKDESRLVVTLVKSY